MTTHKSNPWDGAYKIPWDDLDFSRRMLNEHLSQDHDLASRRSEWIDKHVTWIHEHLLSATPSRILDLGCGPGLYSHRLAKLGHRCTGIDFGPASIKYAQRHSPDERTCDFILGDIRHIDFRGPYDVAMILYGEMNVFSPEEASSILKKVRASLSPQGRLIIEIQAFDAIQGMGRSEPSEQELECGLFSGNPHRCRTENQWLPEMQVAIQTFTVTEASGGPERAYRSTTKAWPDDALVGLLADAGFTTSFRCDAWPSNSDALSLWIASNE
jgi:SAM-dependent methyltransferase